MMTQRLNDLVKAAEQKGLDEVLVYDQANIRALTGIDCDAACLDISLSGRGAPSVRLLTDFRYAAMIHRVAPGLKVGNLRTFAPKGRHIGYEVSMPHTRYLKLEDAAPEAEFEDITDELHAIRAVKTPDEIARITASAQLNDKLWNDLRTKIEPGWTERNIAKFLDVMMRVFGDGEAFATIVCIGKNAAECHHVPDDTEWDGREPILVDMGVKLNGVCSDMTRNIVPKRPRPLYRKVYNLVLKANEAAIAAAKPGITCRALDKIARDIITEGGFGKGFGHALGHGVGYEIHEAPTVAKRDATVLKPGMVITIEPGVYLEDNLGVRIEDLVLITETGCKVLSSSAK